MAAVLEYDLSGAISALIKYETICQTRQRVLIESLQETISMYQEVESEARWTMVMEAFSNLKCFYFRYKEIHHGIESRAEEVKADGAKTKIEAAKLFFDTFLKDYAKYRANYCELEEKRDKAQKDKLVVVPQYPTQAMDRLKLVEALRPKQLLSFAMTPTIWDDVLKSCKTYANESKFSAATPGAQRAFFDSLCELAVRERVEAQLVTANEVDPIYERLLQIADNLFGQDHTHISKYHTYIRSKRTRNEPETMFLSRSTQLMEQANLSKISPETNLLWHNIENLTPKSRDSLFQRFGIELKDLSLEKLGQELRNFERIAAAEQTHKTEHKAMAGDVEGLEPPVVGFQGAQGGQGDQLQGRGGGRGKTKRGRGSGAPPGGRGGGGPEASRDPRTHPWPQALLSVAPVEPMGTTAHSVLCPTASCTAPSASPRETTQVLDVRSSLEESKS